MDALFIFITCDGGKTVHSNANQMTIKYSARWKTSDLPTFLFMQNSTKEPFKYMGKVREHTSCTPTMVCFTLHTTYTALCSVGKTFAPVPFRGTTRYKMGVYQALGATPGKGIDNKGVIVPVKLM
jgi:hypothetical protein